MLDQFESNVKATICFLRLLGVKVNNATVNETLQNHPDWPSLICISDSLNKWNIPNAAGRVDKADINQLPLPFIAYIHDNASPLAIIKEISETQVSYYIKDYRKPIIEERRDFYKKWSGVYLIGETTSGSGEPAYNKVKRKSLSNSMMPVVLFLFLVILSFYFLQARIHNTNINISRAGVYFQYLVLLCSVFVTSLLLWYEVDKNSSILKKVCTGIVKTNCNAILTGKQAKIFNWFSWSEVGFFYFTGGLLALLFVENFISILAWMNILALLYTIFSVYYQWHVAKQWCVLCLAVQILLLLGGVNSVANDLLFSFQNVQFYFITGALIFYLLPVLTWYVVKPYILKLQEAKNTKREYLRIKFNNEIFETLLKKQKAITAVVDGLGIDLGNPIASNILIKVCNPYCGPCAKLHPKIEELLKQNDNIKAKIIFVTNGSDEVSKPVMHLLAIADEKNNARIHRALDDWYMAENKDYDIFAAKYPMNGELAKQVNKLEQMDKWYREMEIAFTPTIFVNGYQLPDVYNIEDLKYFLLD